MYKPDKPTQKRIIESQYANGIDRAYVLPDKRSAGFTVQLNNDYNASTRKLADFVQSIAYGKTVVNHPAQ
jgi:hypothetical protein